MRIAAHVGVKDEVELIGSCIAHLRHIGVSTFIVCDMASTDGTREVLSAHEGPDFTVIDSTNSEPVPEWERRNAAAVAGCEADWLIAIDADEFPLPAGGDLRRLLTSLEADVVSLPRYNIVLGRSGLRMPLPCRPRNYDHVDLFVKTVPDFRKQLAEDPELSWIRFVPLPKVLVRPSFVAGIADGMHDIICHPNQTPRRTVCSRMVIAHAALSSFERFARKIENIREVFAVHDGKLAPGFGWHWRRWLKIADSGLLRDEFEKSILSDDVIDELRAAGIIRSAAAMTGEG